MLSDIAVVCRLACRAVCNCWNCVTASAIFTSCSWEISDWVAVFSCVIWVCWLASCCGDGARRPAD